MLIDTKNFKAFTLAFRLKKSPPPNKLVRMNFTFEQYPSYAWKPGWILETGHCKTSFRKDGSGLFFRLRNTVGRICPNTIDPGWALQIPVPQNCHTSMLFNGFCGYLHYRKKVFAAEVLVPEPGVLWGQRCNIPPPAFVTKRDITPLPDGSQWIESDHEPALLAIRNETFCLITKAHTVDDATRIAESYFNRNLDEALAAERERRSGATALFEQMTRHDALASISVENMLRAIRPAEGDIPHRWSQSPATTAPSLNVDEIYPLALAWRHIDTDIAEELILSALGLQVSSGAIPVTYALNETFSILEAPKPLLAKATERVWEICRNPEFLQKTITPLRRHLQWLLNHFDPKRRGWYFWQNRKECLIPSLYESEAATVDLTVLLLTEIDALNRLCEMAKTSGTHTPHFQNERDLLESNLKTQFWNEQYLDFGNAFIRGRLIRVPGFLGFVPMLWKELPSQQQTLLLERIRESGTLPGGVSILSWRETALDDSTFSLLQQVIALESLKISDSTETMLRDYARIMLEGFVDWHNSADNHGQATIDPVTAAHIINLQQTHAYRYVPKSRLTTLLYTLKQKTRVDRNDLAIILVFALIAFGAHTFYSLKRQPEELPVLRASMSKAYEMRNGAEALKNCIQIIKHYPETDEADVARLYAGNMMMMQGNYKTAETLFLDLRKRKPDCPSAMISLGLALQLQGLFEEADKHYEEFTLLFDIIFPQLTETIQNSRYLMLEGFKSPPNWQKIYGYKMMHEL